MNTTSKTKSGFNVRFRQPEEGPNETEKAEGTPEEPRFTLPVPPSGVQHPRHDHVAKDADHIISIAG